jgi:5-methylcytosine-specific restriction endonuclease McrA
MRNIFRPHYKRRANGVTRIVRDNYSKDWYIIVREVLERDDYQCRHVDEGCIKHCGSKDDLEVHHICPLSRGGKTEKANLLTLCSTHHGGRHSHMKRNGL